MINQKNILAMKVYLKNEKTEKIFYSRAFIFNFSNVINNLAPQINRVL